MGGVSGIHSRARYKLTRKQIWGLAASGSLENCPVAARGFLSGVLQEGYAFGYLVAYVSTSFSPESTASDNLPSEPW